MATPQLSHHHQATTFPQAAEYEKYRQWILGFIQREYNVDCSEVKLALAANFGLGGGGLYMKSTEGVGNLTIAASKTGKTKEELKGKYCVVDADSLWSMKKNKLRTCWVVWHEFGHAAGEPNRAAFGLSEPRAYVFELKAVIAAVNDGTLAGWGLDKALIREFLTSREKDYIAKGDAELKIKTDEILPLVQQLKVLVA